MEKVTEPFKANNSRGQRNLLDDYRSLDLAHLPLFLLSPFLKSMLSFVDEPTPMKDVHLAVLKPSL